MCQPLHDVDLIVDVELDIPRWMAELLQGRVRATVRVGSDDPSQTVAVIIRDQGATVPNQVAMPEVCWKDQLPDEALEIFARRMPSDMLLTMLRRNRHEAMDALSIS